MLLYSLWLLVGGLNEFCFSLQCLAELFKICVSGIFSLNVSLYCCWVDHQKIDATHSAILRANLT